MSHIRAEVNGFERSLMPERGNCPPRTGPHPAHDRFAGRTLPCSSGLPPHLLASSRAAEGGEVSGAIVQRVWLPRSRIAARSGAASAGLGSTVWVHSVERRLPNPDILWQMGVVDVACLATFVFLIPGHYGRSLRSSLNLARWHTAPRPPRARPMSLQQTDEVARVWL